MEWKRYESNYLPPAMGKIGQTELFKLGMATGLRGKL